MHRPDAADDADDLGTLDLAPAPGRDPVRGASGLPPDRAMTRAELREVGVRRSQLDRLLRSGRVVRLLRGVYADAGAVLDRDFRAAAVRLALPPEGIAVRRTAAWVWGLPVVAFGVGDLERSRPVPLQRSDVDATAARVPPRGTTRVNGLLLTDPVTTVLDLGAGDRAEVALAAMDHLLRTGATCHAALLGALGTRPTTAPSRLRSLVAQADGRAAHAGESVLRLHWHASRLPTPTPGLVVGPGLRVGLAVPERRFGVVLETGDGTARGSAPRLRDQGWWVVVMGARDVLRATPERVRLHLEREWHQALLAACE